MMKILLLGGYGNVGRFISELILEKTDCEIILAGRNISKANVFKEILDEKFEGSRIEVCTVDAADKESLSYCFRKSDFIINAASTIEYSKNIAEALVNTKKDYLDVLMSSRSKLNALKKEEPKFVENGQCIVTDGGFHPGIPAALVRYAASEFDELNTANVGSLLNMDWKFEFSSPDTIYEFISEFKEYDSSAYVEGGWKRLGYKDVKYFDFGEPFDNKPCISMMMEEMKALTEIYPTLTETGFYISGFNRFTDYFVTPFIMIAVKIFPKDRLKPVANLFKWSIKNFSKPPYKIALQLIAEGRKNGRQKKLKLQLEHEDGYYFTAAPVFAFLLQYINGSIKKPGLHFQANIVDPKRFIEDLEKLGCVIKINEDI